MYNPDIFNTDAADRQRGGDGGDCAGLIDNIAVDPEGLFNGAQRGGGEGIPVLSGFFKHPVNFGAVPGTHLLSGRGKQPNKFIHYPGNVFLVADADLLPHLRGGGGDSGDILETAGRDQLHMFLPVVQIVNRVHQGRRDHMGQMADGCGDIVVFLVGDNQRDSPERGGKAVVFFHTLRRNLRCGRQNIVGIFKQMIRGVFKSCFFRTGHGMAADKLAGKPQPGYRFVDAGFDASHIRKNAVRANHGFQFFQGFYIISHRGTQENVAAGFKLPVVGRFADGVDKTLFQSRPGSVPGSGIGADPAGRILLFQGFGQRTADQSQSDKTVVIPFHVIAAPFLFRSVLTGFILLWIRPTVKR